MPEYDGRVGRTATQLREYARRSARPLQRVEIGGSEIPPRCPKQSKDGRLVCYLDKGHPESVVCQFRLRALAEQLHSQPRASYVPATATNGNGNGHRE